MKYAIDILKSDLRNELEAREAAKSYRLDEGYKTPSDIEAFDESLRLANERIPQLQAAIIALNVFHDPFTNAPPDNSTGQRPAVQPNVTG